MPALAGRPAPRGPAAPCSSRSRPFPITQDICPNVARGTINRSRRPRIPCVLRERERGTGRGATYEKCGHIDPDLNHVDKPRQVYDGWCRSCGSNAGPQLGEALHADHAPSTSGAEETLRALLRVRLPIATSQEANAVRVRPTAWGALHVFPDLLIPSSRVAIEYDSPGRWAEAHQDDSTDADKDQALRDVGWEVIRIRTGGLATSCWDLIASGPTRKSALEVIAMYNLVLAGARTDFPLYASCGPDERGRVGRSLQARLP